MKKAGLNFALLSCPFCGRKQIRTYIELWVAYVECENCHATVQSPDPAADIDEQEELAIQAWNRRVVLESKARNWNTLTRSPEVKAVIQAYTAEVNRRAENRRSLTGKTVEPHLHAMREINQELGI